MGVADWVVSIAGVTAIPIVTWLVARAARKGTSTDARLATLEEQSRLQADYIFSLRGWIADGKGPPPPPWPEGMNR